MLQLARCELQDDGCRKPRAFLRKGRDSFLRLAPQITGLGLGDVFGGQALRLNQQTGQNRQLFFAVPGLERLQGDFGFSGLLVIEINVIVQPPGTDFGQLVVAKFETAATTQAGADHQSGQRTRDNSKPEGNFRHVGHLYKPIYIVTPTALGRCCHGRR